MTLEEEAVFPCPYFDDGRTARLWLRPVGEAAVEEYGRLLEAGYRRSGDLFYRNGCGGCGACIPIRIDVVAFEPSRSQRRTLRRNADITVTEVVYPKAKPRVDREKLNLYARYLRRKHGNDEAEPIIDLARMHYGYPAIRELQFRLGTRLVAVSVLDETAESFSANYCYYDPDLPERRLGIFTLLEEIRFGRERGKRWHYLGFLIRETSKMAYKEQFRPHELLLGGRWVRPDAACGS